MAVIYRSVFDAAEIRNPAQLNAIIEIAQGNYVQGLPQTGAYGAVMWGHGEVSTVWGAGYALTGDYLRGAAAQRLLDMRNGSRLVIHAKGLEERLKHVARSHDGRTSQGGKMDAFALLKPLQRSLDRGEWSIQTFKKREEPQGYHLAVAEATRALLVARERSRFYPLPEDDHNLIVATDAESDPYELMAKLGGRA